MRKGALTTGSMVCNSIPVDMRTTQLVPGTGLRFGEKVFFGSLAPPLQVKPLPAYGASGQPKNVSFKVWNWNWLICNCELRRIGSTPASTKGAMATGPAMVMRYSRLPFKLRSPPGVTSCRYGIGILTQLLTGTQLPLASGPTGGPAGFLGTNAPVGVLRATLWALGR